MKQQERIEIVEQEIEIEIKKEIEKIQKEKRKKFRVVDDVAQSGSRPLRGSPTLREVD